MADMANTVQAIRGQLQPDFYGTPQGVSLPRGAGLRPVGPTSYPVAPYGAPALGAPTPAAVPPVNVLPTGTTPPNLPGSAGVPALRTPTMPAANMNRGFTLGEGSPLETAGRPVIDVTPPRQIGYNEPIRTMPNAAGLRRLRTATATAPPSSAAALEEAILPRTVGSELASDFVGGARVASLPLTALAFAPQIVGAISNASQTSGLGYQQGVRKVPTMFGNPQGEISTMGISNTNPFTGSRVANLVAPAAAIGTPGVAQAATLPVTPPAPSNPAGLRAKFIADEGDQPAMQQAFVQNEGAPAGGLRNLATITDPSGKALASGDVTYDPAAEAARLKANNVTAYDQNAQHVDQVYADQVAQADRVNAANGIPGAGGLRFRTTGDYLSGARPQTGLGALLALGAAGQQAQQYNENQQVQTQLGIAGLKARSEAALQAAQAQAALQHGSYFSALGALKDSQIGNLFEKLNTMREVQAMKDAQHEASLKVAAEKPEIAAVMGDATEAPIYRALGSDLGTYRAARQLMSRGGIVYQPKPFKTGIYGFRDTNPAGFYTADGQPVDMMSLAGKWAQQQGQ